MTNLAGLHDKESTVLGISGTWVLDTIALSENPQPPIYDPAFTWIGRANWGYGSIGTLPVPDQYEEYVARLCAHVRGSQNCHRWVIGNEPNLSREWPDGQPIFPWYYAQCYRKARKAIRAMQGHEYDEVLIAASGPWNDELKYPGNVDGDWITYFEDVIEECGDNIGGFSLHAYTHGYNVALVTSSARMQAPFAHRHYEFRAYRDYMEAIPTDLRHLPCYITEANGNGPWQAVGLMPAMLNEIDDWNHSNTQRIRAVIFFRYPKKDDGYHIEGRGDVIAEYKVAVAQGYISPLPTAQSQPKQETHLPTVSTGTPAKPTLPERNIDPRATARGVKIETPEVAPGENYWHVKEIRWYNEQEADGLGPDHHIMVDVLDLAGQRVPGQSLLVEWPTDHTLIFSETKQGEPYSANYPMTPSRNDFSVRVDGGNGPSEIVHGIGMGVDTPSGFNPGIHTTTGVVFQRATMPTVAVPSQPPAPPIEPGEPTPAYVKVTSGANIRSEPKTGKVLIAVPYGDQVAIVGIDPVSGWNMVRYRSTIGWMSPDLVQGEPVEVKPEPTQPEQGDKWQRSIAFVRRWEGGWADDPNDPGGATNKGITIGTFAAWREQHGQPEPTKDDLRALTDEEANRIFFEWYWLPSGADKLPWPTCLAVLDLAVNGGTGRAREAFAAVGHNNFMAYMAWRLDWYTRIDGWKHFGTAWARRVADLMREATK